jgi:uncharacterized membrane protein HdeD (DUF308 family)
MEQSQHRNPSPKFYKTIAVAFLVIGAWLIWQAVLRHEWFYWVIGILTIINGLMSGLKSLVPRETRR